MLDAQQSQQLLTNVLGDSNLAAAIKQAKLLMVGCGGIGCEVIKNLMLMGFQDVVMMDLDTIDVSNLNRQFLFNKTHINQSKAQVSAQVAKNLFAHGEHVQLHPIHGSVQNADDPVDYFRQFTLVINALDNRQARTHVNRMCLAADVPLIESGSEGYLANTFVIKKNISMCYECDGQKPEQRTYASCTIRNTPSLPIHCIVWAKHLFAQLFGEEDPDNDVSPDMSDPELNEQADNKENEKKAEQNGKSEQPSFRKWVQTIDYDSHLLFDKLFRVDIEYLHTMDKLWKNRTKPRVLSFDKLDELDVEQVATTSAIVQEQENGSENENDKSLKDQRMWSLSECYEIFSNSVKTLKERLKTEQFLVWDKDDEPALNFVTAVSNLRSFSFHIDRKSKFDVKSMAGNIIPAISSTNSIVGGLMVVQILNILRKLANMSSEEKEDRKKIEAAYRDVCKHVYLRKIGVSINKLIPSYDMFEPNPSCLVCNTKNIPEVEITLDFTSVSMSEFAEQILLSRLNFVCPEIQLDGQPIIVWSKDDLEDYTEEEMQEYRSNPISTYTAITDRARLRVYDLLQNLTIIITLANGKVNEIENASQFYKMVITSEAKPSVKEEQTADDVVDFVKPSKLSNSEKIAENDEIECVMSSTSEEICEVISNVENISTNGSKDQNIVLLSDSEDEAQETAPLINENEDEITIIEDDSDSDLQLIDTQEKRKASPDLGNERNKKLRTE